MRIITELNLPYKEKTVLSIGNFDGVHLGHAKLIKVFTDISREEKQPGIVFTFAQNPKSFFTGVPIKYITGTEDKMRILSQLGAKNIYFADFEEMRDLSDQEFVDRVIIEKFNAKTVVCGYDFRFGKDRIGNTETLKEMLAAKDINLTVIKAETIDGKEISSTWIRQLLINGEAEAAERLLGRPYNFNLPVVSGRQIGRSLKFPTINQEFPPYRIVPAFGVYAVLCEAKGETYQGIANIGVRPTVNKGRSEEEVLPLCETHLFGFDGDLYHQNVRVSLKKRLREEIEFSSMAELKAQINRDVITAKEYFEKKEDKE